MAVLRTDVVDAWLVLHGAAPVGELQRRQALLAIVHQRVDRRYHGRVGIAADTVNGERGGGGVKKGGMLFTLVSTGLRGG
jgi:hypothetical protein